MLPSSLSHMTEWHRHWLWISSTTKCWTRTYISSPASGKFQHSLPFWLTNMVSITVSITSQYGVTFFILSVNPFQLTATGVVNNKQTGIQNNETLQSCMSEKNPKCATKSAPSVHQTHVVLLTHRETRINCSYTCNCNDMTITSEAETSFCSTLPHVQYPFCPMIIYMSLKIFGTGGWMEHLVLQKRNYNLKILQLEVSSSYKPPPVSSCFHTNLKRSNRCSCKCFSSCRLYPCPHRMTLYNNLVCGQHGGA